MDVLMGSGWRRFKVSTDPKDPRESRIGWRKKFTSGLDKFAGKQIHVSLPAIKKQPAKHTPRARQEQRFLLWGHSVHVDTQTIHNRVKKKHSMK